MRHRQPVYGQSWNLVNGAPHGASVRHYTKMDTTISFTVEQPQNTSDVARCAYLRAYRLPHIGHACCRCGSCDFICRVKCSFRLKSLPHPGILHWTRFSRGVCESGKFDVWSMILSQSTAGGIAPAMWRRRVIGQERKFFNTNQESRPCLYGTNTWRVLCADCKMIPYLAQIGLHSRSRSDHGSSP